MRLQRRRENRGSPLTPAHLKMIEDLAAKWEAQEGAIAEIDAKLKDLKPKAADTLYIRSLWGVWHKTGTLEGKPSNAWKTIGCGWAFGKSVFEKFADEPKDAHYLEVCERCLPALRRGREAAYRRWKGKKGDDDLSE